MFKRFFAWLDRNAQKGGHNNLVSQIKERPKGPAPMKPEGPPNRIVREGLFKFSWLGPNSWQHKTDSAYWRHITRKHIIPEIALWDKRRGEN